MSIARRKQLNTSVFDGDTADCLVHVPESGQISKLQVRCVHSPSKHGLPVIRLKCAEGHNQRRRYREGEFDFIVGYYLFNDTAYVFSSDEVKQHKLTSLSLKSTPSGGTNYEIS
jgi:hypothetical protein